jgi:hypothetical protein
MLKLSVLPVPRYRPFVTLQRSVKANWYCMVSLKRTGGSLQKVSGSLSGRVDGDACRCRLVFGAAPVLIGDVKHWSGAVLRGVKELRSSVYSE